MNVLAQSAETTEVIRLTKPNQTQMTSDAQGCLDIAENWIIDTAEMYELAAGELQDIKARAARMEEQRKAITRPLDDAKKATMEIFRRPLELLTLAEQRIKASMLGYKKEQERIAAEQQRKLDEAARVEREKHEAEARRLQREAAEAAESGDTGKAAELATAATTETLTAAVITAPTLATEAPKVAGISTRVTWGAEVIDLHALVRHVAEHPEHIGLVQADTKALNAMAKALKDTLAIPGVKAVATESIAANRK